MTTTPPPRPMRAAAIAQTPPPLNVQLHAVARVVRTIAYAPPRRGQDAAAHAADAARARRDLLSYAALGRRQDAAHAAGQAAR